MTQAAKASQRRPSHEWRLAPCGSADTRCANLRAIFDSVVLALSTNFMVQIDLVWAQLSPALRFASILKVYVEGKAACQVCELRCAPKSGMAPRGSHFLIRKGCRHPKFSSSCAPNHGAWMAGTSQKHSCGCALFVFSLLYEPASGNRRYSSSCIEITYYRDHSRDHSRDTRDHAKVNHGPTSLRGRGKGPTAAQR